MHLQSLKLLCPTVKEKMHLQEMNYLTLTFGSRSHETLYRIPLHHVPYAPAKFEDATSNSLGEDTITRNVADGCIERQQLQEMWQMDA